MIRNYQQKYKYYQRVLECINKIVEGHGVEVIGDCNSCRDEDIHAEYVNMGDTYNTTILYNRHTGTFNLTSWGDFVERHPYYCK